MNDLERIAVAIAPYLPADAAPYDVARQVVDALHALPTGAELISAERVRQVVSEGWTPDHDRAHPVGVLAAAGCAYALTATSQLYLSRNVASLESEAREAEERGHHDVGAALRLEAEALDSPPPGPSWPFDLDAWKPEDPIRNLVKAGALLAAEIDRSRP